MIPTYGKILSVIEKALWELVEKYQEVGRLLWNLVEDQKRNTAQLERIRAVLEWRWGSEKENEKEGSEDSFGKSWERETLLFTFY